MKANEAHAMKDLLLTVIVGATAASVVLTVLVFSLRGEEETATGSVSQAPAADKPVDPVAQIVVVRPDAEQPMWDAPKNVDQRTAPVREWLVVAPAGEPLPTVPQIKDQMDDEGLPLPHAVAELEEHWDAYGGRALAVIGRRGWMAVDPRNKAPFVSVEGFGGGDGRAACYVDGQGFKYADALTKGTPVVVAGVVRAPSPNVILSPCHVLGAGQ